jgi:hypothetical protein
MEPKSTDIALDLGGGASGSYPEFIAVVLGRNLLAIEWIRSAEASFGVKAFSRGFASSCYNSKKQIYHL